MRARALLFFFSAAAAVAACSGANTDPTGDALDVKEGKPAADAKKDGGAPAPSGSGSAKPPAPAPAPGATCDGTSCATGCCANNQCFTDHTNDHCSIGGVACPAPCSAGQTCQANGGIYACAAGGATGNYRVVLVSAKVTTAKDVYVNKGTFGTLVIARLPTMNGVTVATWNADVGTLAADKVVGASVTLEIKNDKFGFDELLGNCRHTVTAAELAAGQLVLAKTTDCDGSVEEARFELKKTP